MATSSDARMLEQERDLYRRLLELGATDELEPFLADALGLMVEVTGAERGYLEVRDPQQESDRSWSIAHACEGDEIEGIRGAISSGVIAETLSTGQTILTSISARTSDGRRYPEVFRRG